SIALLIYLHSAFFFQVPATTAIYTLSLHDALPISMLWFDCATVPDTRCCCRPARSGSIGPTRRRVAFVVCHAHRSRSASRCPSRSEEHTSELQSRGHLVCRLLLEKKKYASLRPS